MSHRPQIYKLCLSIALCLWTLYLFFPGAYSIDSWNQWKEAAAGHYDDWYGTGYATTWRWLWKLTGDLRCMFVFQMMVYWAFITALLWPIPLKSKGYWIMLLLGLFFCLIPQFVMRDSLTVLAWSMAMILFIRAARRPRYRTALTIIGLLLLAYGLWLRINALIALLPLLYIGVILLGGEVLAAWKRILIVIVACIFIFLTIRIGTYQVQKSTRAYPEYKLRLLDLSGISRLSGENLFPVEFNRHPYFQFDTLMRLYTPAGIDEIYWRDTEHPIWPYPNDSLNKLVGHAWINAIRRHPLYYLENRFTGFLYYLRIKKRFPTGQYWNAPVFYIEPKGPLPPNTNWTPMMHKISELYRWFNGALVYEPWFWLLLNAVGFGLFVRYMRKRPAGDRQFWLIHACIQLSGIFFIFSQLLIYQHDRDFRYTYWNVIVALFAVTALLFAPNRSSR